MITINNHDYNCLKFKPKHEGSVDFLKVEIEGELKDTSSNLHIDYHGEHYYGYKTLPTEKDGKTDFSVYIYQPGDSEVEVNFGR